MVALFRDELISIWRRPTLGVRVALTVPDCHKTEIAVRNVITGEVITTWPCFYLRIWIQNDGRARASRVEVFARRLLRKHADGEFRQEPQFLPLNLKWSHTGEVVAPGISSGMGRFCDVAHIVQPAHTAAAGHSIPGLLEGQPVLCLDLQVAPNTRTHLLPPAVYRLDVRVAAENSAPVDRTIEVTVTGQWFDDEIRMFKDGLGFKQV